MVRIFSNKEESNYNLNFILRYLYISSDIGVRCKNASIRQISDIRLNNPDSRITKFVNL